MGVTSDSKIIQWDLEKIGKIMYDPENSDGDENDKVLRASAIFDLKSNFYIDNFT